LFEIGKLLIGLYLGKSGVTSGFGAAGSVVVLLVWIYYSAQVFLLGAEFTWVYAHSHGSKVARPEPNPAAGAEPLRRSRSASAAKALLRLTFSARKNERSSRRARCRRTLRIDTSSSSGGTRSLDTVSS
jgi:hypothetical protein